MKFNLLHLFTQEKDAYIGYQRISKYKQLYGDATPGTIIASTHRRLNLPQYAALKAKQVRFKNDIDRVTADFLTDPETVMTALQPIFRRYQLVADEFGLLYYDESADLRKETRDGNAALIEIRKEIKGKINEKLDGLLAMARAKVLIAPNQSSLIQQLEELQDLVGEL